MSDAGGHEIHLEPNANNREWIYMEAIKIRGSLIVGGI